MLLLSYYGLNVGTFTVVIDNDQQQVAEILLMPQQQYSRFESGKYELNYSLIVKLCKLYDISSDYLLGLKKY